MPDTATKRLLRGRYGGLVSKEDLSAGALNDPVCKRLAVDIERHMAAIAAGEKEWSQVRSEFKKARLVMERALGRINRARLRAYQHACTAYAHREQRKLELMREMRSARITMIREKLNVGLQGLANPLSLSVEKRVQLHRMKKAIRGSAAAVGDQVPAGGCTNG